MECLETQMLWLNLQKRAAGDERFLLGCQNPEMKISLKQYNLMYDDRAATIKNDLRKRSMARKAQLIILRLKREAYEKHNLQDLFLVGQCPLLFVVGWKPILRNNFI